MWLPLLPAISDEAMAENIQQELRKTDLLPAEHFVDAGYASARVLVSSQEQLETQMVCPISVDTGWQAYTTCGIDASQFLLDWEHRQATCPTSEKRVPVGVG
jgi:hypothetical protein